MSQDTARIRRVAFRITQDEHDLLFAAAHARRMSMSEWMRHVLQGGHGERIIKRRGPRLPKGP
jgi:uncharacterized protein (DUF1778 family)